MDVCIYGTGRYGMAAYYELSKRGESIVCFGDKNAEKQGYVVGSIKCISLEEMSKLDKSRTVIIVAIKKDNNQLVSMFRQMGFKYVYGYNDVNDKSDKWKTMPLINQNKIKNEKRYIEKAILHNGIGDGTLVSDDIEKIVEALEKRRKYESIRG